MLLIMLCALPGWVVAQQKTLSGKVTDAARKPLPGVTVAVRTTNGTAPGTDAYTSAATTNAEGAFSITVPATATELIFSFVGKKDLVEKIGTRTIFEVTLADSDDQLSDVVVVGYGTRKKETLTGSVSNISNKDIQTTTNVSLAQKLQGKVAGLQIRQLGGEPGTFENMINLRGFGTPLFVIDGIVRDGSGEFQRLNADDIESVSFLKDASAAIYGFGSSNGVVIVTTKKGARGRATFNYTGVVGFSQPTDVPRMASASEWMQMRNDAALLATGAPFVSKEELQKWIDGAPGYESTDWYDVAMKKTAIQQQHNISTSGGNEKTQYYIGLAYVDENSYLRSNDMNYKRYNFRSNITTELVKNLKAEVLIGGRYDKRTTPGENFFNIFKGTRVTLPTERPYANNNPEYPAVVSPSNQNPLALSNANLTGYSETVNRNVQSTFSLIYDVPFVKGLSLKGTAAYDLNSYQGKDVSKPYKLYTYVNNEYVLSPQRVGTGGISNGYGNSNRFVVIAQANYATTIANKHNVSGLAAFEQRQDWGRNADLRRLYDFYTIDQINAASANNMTNSGGEGQSSSQAVLGRFNYDYDKKYLLEVAFRYMGTFAYPPETRWGFFPIISGGWRLSEENFMKNVSFISNLKLRGSYGEVGEQAGGPFQWIQGFPLGGGGQYEFENGAGTAGASAPGLVNPLLTWVTAKTTDIGIELGLFNNRLTFEGAVYRRDRTGIPALRNLSLPNTFGTSLAQENLNSDRTQGIEFTIGYNDRVGKDFRFGVSGNFNFARSQNLYVERGPFQSSWDRWKNGNAYRYDDIIWSYTYLGQFQNPDDIASYPLQNGDQANIRELPGDFKYADINNDGMIDDKDMLPMYLGANGSNDNQNPRGKNPKINFGLTLNASYKGFDLNMLIQGAAMYTVRFSEVYAEVMAFRGNTPAYFFDRWHLSDPYDAKSQWIPGKWPASRFNGDVGSMYKESSVWRKDASYARLKSLELGYTFPIEWFSGSGIRKLRLYASGFNLFTIADPFVKAFDPERLEGLFNAGFNYPLSKIYNVGINLNF
ncbi:SusC/RagA family TonB-linked outer membrane protein [Paraflavitalea pollutisoli]|uniref:SusC/RagA family TonB-linked outer membrane protein n=1 Tax=Paraflavitalea pollutisoli TaxID=3034143 RepID=UPI0023EC13AC|nr:TonB-dependent receptor [Paraflavitalea sp. H1-2-19X]